MTDIEQKALALLRECVGNARWKRPIETINRQSDLLHEALCRAIEQREAFRQEVSDAVGDTLFMAETHCDGEAVALVSNRLMRFIIAKSDPLVEAWDEAWRELNDKPAKLETFRAALDARGLEIREKNDGY